MKNILQNLDAGFLAFHITRPEGASTCPLIKFGAPVRLFLHLFGRWIVPPNPSTYAFQRTRPRHVVDL